MLLQYSFRKSFLVSSPPLKPDQQPIQHLLPPQIPPSSMVRTYSFSQLKNNESLKEQLNDSSSIDLGRNAKLVDQLQTRIQKLQLEVEREKEKRVKASEECRQWQERCELVEGELKQRQREEPVREEKKDLLKAIHQLQQELNQAQSQLSEKSQLLSTYEARSQQSRKLLQKLNENINKKESKLIKDKEIIMKELEQAKNLVEESQKREEQSQKEVMVIKEELDRVVKLKEKEVKAEFEVKSREVMEEYERRLGEKQEEIEQLHGRISDMQTEYEQQIQQMKHSMSEQQSAKFQTQSQLKHLHLQLQQSTLLITHLQSQNLQLQTQLIGLQSNLQNLHTSTQSTKDIEKSKIQKLEIQIANSEFYLKENEKKIEVLEEEVERMNVAVNQLKEDKRLLIREKEELKGQVMDKSALCQQLRGRVDSGKEMEIKYSAIIENYEKEQEKLYDQEAVYTQTIANLQVRIKSAAIDIEKLNLSLSQKQQQVNRLAKQSEKYKKMYKKQHQTLEMYKQETQSIKEKKELKWNQLKAYYQSEISMLEDRVNQLQSMNSNDSRIKLKNLMSNEKAKISTSRLVASRNTVRQREGQDHHDTPIHNIDSHVTQKRKLVYRPNDPEEQLKQNYWHGLNNDSLEQDDEEGSKI